MRRAARARQQGVSGAYLIIAIVLIGVAVLLARGLSRTEVDVQAEAATDQRLRRLSEALAAFATTQGRLPCPALGTADTGDEAVGVPANTCDANALTVPWRTLGLKRDEGLDGWGRKVSYRVFSGSTGFTTAGSASVVDCNSNPDASPSPTLSASRCGASHLNTAATFVSARSPMLQVNDRGTMRSDLAFVLVSHGATGRGAFAAEGGTRSELPAAGGAESVNALSTPPFRIESRSAAGVASSDVAHFDDLVLYRSFLQLAAEAKLGARDWGADPTGITTSSKAFTLAAVAAAGGSTAGSNTGQSSLTFNAGTGREVQVYAAGNTSQNVSTGGSTGEGIGTIETGGSAASAAAISSANGEALILFTPNSRGRYFGARLFDFGTVSGDAERVRLSFFTLSPFVLVGQVTKTACKVDPARSNITGVNPGGEFDVVVVEPLSRAGGTGPSELFLGTFAYCNSTQPACRAPGAEAVDDCP